MSSVKNLLILSGKVSTNSIILGIKSTNPASADSPKNFIKGLSMNPPPPLELLIADELPVRETPEDASAAFLCSFLSLSFSLNALFLSSTKSFFRDLVKSIRILFVSNRFLFDSLKFSTTLSSLLILGAAGDSLRISFSKSSKPAGSFS